MSANDINVPAFINDVFMRPPIWDGSFGNKDLLWRDIGANHNFLPVETLKKKWENLRRSFRNQMKKIPRSVDNLYLIHPQDMPSTWPYYRSMLFLVGRVRLGNQVQSLPAPVKTENRPAPVKTENRPIDSIPSNVDRKRTRAADLLDESDQSSKKKRNQTVETTNVERSHSSATLDGHDGQNGQNVAGNNAVPTKTASSASMALNWGDNHDSHLIKDSDRYYLKSLLPYLDKLDAVQKLEVRSKIDEILREEISK